MSQTFRASDLLVKDLFRVCEEWCKEHHSHYRQKWRRPTADDVVTWVQEQDDGMVWWLCRKESLVDPAQICRDDGCGWSVVIPLDTEPPKETE